ncbi:MAG: Fic family protein [Candidatus Melainabacteria bacterium]|nr:Fic family protein [Candidatus Melainabacteria bacterium]
MSRYLNILKILQNKELSHDEILASLKEEGIKISRASLNRDLLELRKQNLVSTTGKARASKYKLSKAYQLIHEINPQEYFYKEFNERKIISNFKPEIIEQVLESQEKVFTEDELARLQEANQQYKANRKLLGQTLIKKNLEIFTIDFAWKSSKIEGNTYTLLETETLLKTQRTAAGKTKDEAIMLLNHKAAIDYILEQAELFQTISSSKVSVLHEILTKELNVKAGIRTNPVRIGGTNYKPLDNQFQIQEALEASCVAINQIDNIFCKALATMALIAYLQAYEDGNKRTSRTLTNAILLAHNYCPLSYRNIDEAEYKKALLIFYEQNNLSYLKQIFIEQFIFAVETYWA